MSHKRDRKPPGPARSGQADARVTAKIPTAAADYVRAVPGGASYAVRRALFMLMQEHPDPLKVVGTDLV